MSLFNREEWSNTNIEDFRTICNLNEKVGYLNRQLLYAKEAIFKLIAQFHGVYKFDDGELYMCNDCESALEAAFMVLGITKNYIKLMDF